MKAFLVLAYEEGVTAAALNAALAEYNATTAKVMVVDCLGYRSNFVDVQAFHEKFGLDRDRPVAPRPLPDDLQRYRLGFLIEELAEYAQAVGAAAIATQLTMLAQTARVADLDATRCSLVEAFDALLDLSVVTLGTADFHGFPWERGWDVVLARNLAKRRAKPDGSDSKRGSPFDVIKPEGWYGPEKELTALLKGEAT